MVAELFYKKAIIFGGQNWYCIFYIREGNKVINFLRSINLKGSEIPLVEFEPAYYSDLAVQHVSHFGLE